MSPTEHRLIRQHLLQARRDAEHTARTAKWLETRERNRGRVAAYAVALRLIGRPSKSTPGCAAGGVVP